MKKIVIALLSGIVFVACNNSDTTGKDNPDNNMDSLDHTVTDDRNNRNTTVYDSAAPRQEKDTASYERMPNKISDSTPR
jgi:hypothetical protein